VNPQPDSGLLVGGRDGRALAGGPTRADELRATRDAGQPDSRASSVASDRDDEAGRLDAAAGCEFVDDRIRLPE